MFRRPEIAEAIKNTFLGPRSDVADETPTEGSICSDDEEETVEPLEAPSIHPAKAATLFDTTEGLGEWHIIFTPRAIWGLRRARDGKLFNIFVKKIK